MDLLSDDVTLSVTDPLDAVEQAVIDRFVAAAGSLGYPTDELIFVDQSPSP